MVLVGEEPDDGEDDYVSLFQRLAKVNLQIRRQGLLPELLVSKAVLYLAMNNFEEAEATAWELNAVADVGSAAEIEAKRILLKCASKLKPKRNPKNVGVEERAKE